jgi:hypothetical protein
MLGCSPIQLDAHLNVAAEEDTIYRLSVLRPDYGWDLSNPIRYPRFRPSVSGMFQQIAFAFGVLTDINAFYRYTSNSICLSHPLVLQYHPQPPG